MSKTKQSTTLTILSCRPKTLSAIFRGSLTIMGAMLALTRRTKRRPGDKVCRAPDRSLRPLRIANIISCHNPLLAALGSLSLLVSTGCTRAAPVLEEVETLQLPYGVQSIAWHPDGKRLAAGYFLKEKVEVWDTRTKLPSFEVPSKRHPINPSGQEVLFSPDGKYLVVQDTEDTRNGSPPFPRTRDDPLEATAEADKTRLILARIWDVAAQKEVAQIRGPGSWLHHGSANGMCWVGDSGHTLAVLRGAAVATYDVPSGSAISETSLLYPFKDHPNIYHGYRRMSCHPSKLEVALEGGRFDEKKAVALGLPRADGVTPIVIADLESHQVRKLLISQTPLNGVAYTADGQKLVSFGHTPIRIWSVAADYAPAGEIVAPALPTDYLAAVPDYDGLLGMSAEGTVHSLYLWDVSQRRPSAHVLAPRDTFRIAVNQQASTIAVADGSRVRLYRFNKIALNSTKKNGN